MTAQGIIVKMPVRLEEGSAKYTLRLEQPRPSAGAEPAAFQEISLNELVGRDISIVHTGGYTCIRCGRSVDRLFGEGFCFPCFRDAPEAGECIVRPELCEAHLGGGRDPEWEEEHHNQPHAVYLAVTSAVKVGVTRETQIPTRWIDQGAAWAVQIARVPYRQLAGRIEVALKALYTDRTTWQRMLKGEALETVDLAGEAHKIAEHLDAELVPYLTAVDHLRRIDIQYPVRTVLTKVRSTGLQKNPVVTGRLEGIRGQYLILDGGKVVNMRRHSGYVVSVTV